MTPKEKAEDLVRVYFNLLPISATFEYSLSICKQCALIAVDEILLFLSLQLGFYDEKAVKYFTEVKKEIKNL